MERIKIQNAIRTAVWCVALAVCGVIVALTFLASDFWPKYYNMAGYAILEAVATALTILFAFLWWRCATSGSVSMQGPRMWISEHGGVAPWVFSIPVWLVAGVTHMVSFMAFQESSDGGTVFFVFVLPCLYMALSYLLPPVEISETIAPFTGIAHNVVRIVLALSFLSLGAWVFWWNAL